MLPEASEGHPGGDGDDRGPGDVALREPPADPLNDILRQLSHLTNVLLFREIPQKNEELRQRGGVRGQSAVLRRGPVGRVPGLPHGEGETLEIGEINRTDAFTNIPGRGRHFLNRESRNTRKAINRNFTI